MRRKSTPKKVKYPAPKSVGESGLMMSTPSTRRNYTNYFETEFSRSLKFHEAKHDDFLWYRVQDTKFLRYYGHENIIADKVPCDFIASVSGRLHLFELKSSRQQTPYYRLDYIRPHQLEELLKAQARGSVSWFVFNNRQDRTNISAYAVKPEKVEEWMKRKPRRVTWKEIQEAGISLMRLRGASWRILPLMVPFESFQSIHDTHDTHEKSHENTGELKMGKRKTT